MLFIRRPLSIKLVVGERGGWSSDIPSERTKNDNDDDDDDTRSASNWGRSGLTADAVAVLAGIYLFIYFFAYAAAAEGMIDILYLE